MFVTFGFEMFNNLSTLRTNVLCVKHLFAIKYLILDIYNNCIDMNFREIQTTNIFETMRALTHNVQALSNWIANLRKKYVKQGKLQF